MTDTQRQNVSAAHSLITMRPEVVSVSGFTHQFFVSGISGDVEVEAALLAAMSGRAAVGLSKSDRALAIRVADSYQKKRAGEPLAEEDYILDGHELLECRNLDPKDVPRYVAYRYRYNKFPQLKIVDEFPPCVQVEVTSVCNYRCIMCYQIDKSFSNKSSGHMGSMELDLFKRTIDQVEGRAEAITLASRGEPLLHPEIAAMLDYCRGKFLALKLNTNASLLTESACHSLLSSGIQTLVFSIDASSKEAYEKIRVRGSFDKVRANLERFSIIRSQQYRDSRMIVRISGVKINQDQNLEAMKSQWEPYADAISFTNYNPWQSAYDNEPNDVS
ncbi:MAG: radical SAM protein, partial [Alphaproteobacteria bacterium]|nr:radical SAM protein [Alphaproteobacteria bacterium]